MGIKKSTLSVIAVEVVSVTGAFIHEPPLLMEIIEVGGVSGTGIYVEGNVN